MRPPARRRLRALACALLLAGGVGALCYVDAHRTPLVSASALRLSHASGAHDGPLVLEIASSADVIYTLDGSIPTPEAHRRYERPLRFEAGEVVVLRARTLDRGHLGPTVTRHYVVGLDAHLPVLSLAVEPADLWGEEEGIFRHYDMRGEDWERLGHLAYLDHPTDGSVRAPAAEGIVGVRVHGDWSRQFEKRSLRLYWRRAYGQAALVYPLFGPDGRGQFSTVVVHSGGEDWHSVPDREWSLLCNQLGAELMTQMGGYATLSQPVLLYLNGQPMGIYYLRERVHERLLAEGHGVRDAEILRDPDNPAQRDVVRGDAAAWDALVDYAAQHDLREPGALAHVARLVDLENLTDYYLLQIYAANNDWPHQNVTVFRDPAGDDRRFRFLLWDIDHAFWIDSDLHIDMVHWLYTPHPSLPEMGDTLLIRRLLENEGFREAFLGRAAHLLNTTLHPDNVIAALERLAARIAPDIALEEQRWQSTRPWTEHLERMRDFARRRPDIVRQHLVDRFGLSGTHRLAVRAPDPAEGAVWVNDMPLIGDYEGIHFPGVAVEVRAEPAPGHSLVGWEGLPGEMGTLLYIRYPLPTDEALRPVFARDRE